MGGGGQVDPTLIIFILVLTWGPRLSPYSQLSISLTWNSSSRNHLLRSLVMTRGWAKFKFITFPTTSRCATVAGILILLGIKKDHITSYLPKLSTRSSPRLCGAKTSTRRLKKVDTVNTENGWRDKFTILNKNKDDNTHKSKALKRYDRRALTFEEC